MVVNKQKIDLAALDIAYLGFFLGLRANELVMEKLRKEGFTGFRESHGYVLQHFVDADRSVTELAQRMEMTQQAASKTVAELIKLGFLEPVPSRDKRAKLISMAERGWNHLQVVRQFRKRLEKRLVKRLGEETYGDVRAALIESLEALGRMDRIRTRRVRSPR